MPAEMLAILRTDTQRLVEFGAAGTALTIGQSIPAFTLPNATGAVIRSDDLLHQGPLVISFYRGAWCPYCNLDLRALQDTLPVIRSAGAQLVAISPNLPDKSLTSIGKSAL